MLNSKSEIVDIIENWNLPFSLGNAIQHIVNSKDSNFENIEELKSAVWYIQKRIELIEKEFNFDFKKISLDRILFKCINLQERKDRKEWVQSHLSKFNLNFEFFPGFTNSEKYPNLNFGTKYTIGHKGCATSHYDIIKTYKGNKILGIFEDDVQLSDDFLERMKYIEQNFDSEWDMFFLSSFYHLNDDKLKWHKTGDFELTDVKYIHRVYGTFCAHAYLINPNSIEKIISLIESHIQDSYAIDHLYILIQPYLNCFSFTPGMATQIKGHSSIDNREKNQAEFEKIIGKHYFVNNLNDFDYDEYFKKYKK